MFLKSYLIAKFEICVLTTLTRPQFSKVKICAIGYVNTPYTLFWLIVPYKSVRGLQNLPSMVA